MKILVVLWAVAAAAASATAPADCPVCLNGVCQALQMQLKHAEGNSDVIVYHKDNIMYYAEGSTLKKVNLDDNTSEVVLTVEDRDIKTIAIDVVNGDVYYTGARSDVEYEIYKYEPKSNETETLTIPRLENYLPPSKLLAYNGTVYYNSRTGRNLRLHKGLNIFDGTTFRKVTPLGNIFVLDIVFDNIGNLYMKSNGILYKLNVNEDGPLELTQIGQDIGTIFIQTIISGSNNGELRMTDTVRRIIYQLNPFTNKVNMIGGFDDADAEDKRVFFDKNNNVIINSKSSIAYYKATADKCVADAQNYRVNITKMYVSKN